MSLKEIRTRDSLTQSPTCCHLSYHQGSYQANIIFKSSHPFLFLVLPGSQRRVVAVLVVVEALVVGFASVDPLASMIRRSAQHILIRPPTDRR